MEPHGFSFFTAVKITTDRETMTGITINRLEFNDGTSIDLTPRDIVVFVGPNNMGKSQSLRDINNSISFDHGSLVVTDVDVEYHQPQGLRGVLENNALKSPNGQHFLYKGYGYQIHSAIVNSFGQKRYTDEHIKNFLVSMVKTEDRLTTSSPKQMVNPGEPNQHPLQYVIDPENRQRMSEIFEKIFGKKIFCMDRGTTQLTLHMGNDIVFNQGVMKPQQVSDELYRRMKALPKVHEQGDGIRSLAGLLLNLMIPYYTMFLIDEPEAFLHPPQARVLGENIPAQLGERQAFISTHSIELIKGLLTADAHRVKLIRLTRDGDINHVHYLQQADLDEVWNDPIMRHSNLLDGLFYTNTVLCESDSDCQLYAAMLSHIKEGRGSYSDALFTLCNGKGRMKALSKILKSLGIDYRIVPDIDFFNDEILVKTVYENCGGDWAAIESDYRTLYNAMNQPDGTLSHEAFLEKVHNMIISRGWVEMTKPYIKKLGKDLPQILENQWDKLKHQGINSIVEHDVKVAAERLITAMNAVGVFPVKNGELESFFPDVTSHGPGYAVAVLEKYPDLGAAEYNEMRAFVQSWGI